MIKIGATKSGGGEGWSTDELRKNLQLQRPLVQMSSCAYDDKIRNLRTFYIFHFFKKSYPPPGIFYTYLFRHVFSNDNTIAYKRIIFNAYRYTMISFLQDTTLSILFIRGDHRVKQNGHSESIYFLRIFVLCLPLTSSSKM